MKLPDIHNCKIAIVGLGYVGLPLALEFSNSRKCLRSNKEVNQKVIGFDINKKRIEKLKNGIDDTNECKKEKLLHNKSLTFTSNQDSLSEADIFIVTVPTPVDKSKNPNLIPLKNASKTIGKIIKKKFKTNKEILTPIIIYESTVFPGATEEECVPILEEYSDLKFNKDFLCGYSPERINPGDPSHNLCNIKKVTSGSNSIAANWIDDLYGTIIKAGTFKANSIKVAEAAKVIENTQRDINIALINELAKIFKLLDIDTFEVLEAAGTKWNFINFKPGLVGGHCIGVDPYYLTFKAEQVGYNSEIVLAGRRLNDGMPQWIAQELIKEMSKRKIELSKSKILIAGITFKENCPDLRNSKVVDLVQILKKFNLQIEITDPWVNSSDENILNGLKIQKNLNKEKKFSVIVMAVAHDQFKNVSLNTWQKMIDDNGFFYDLKNIIPKDLNPIRF